MEHKQRRVAIAFQQQQNCLHQSLPENLGVGHSNIFQLDQDLSYIETRYTPSKDLAVLSQMEYQEPRLVVTLGLKGRPALQEIHGDEVTFNEGYTTITTITSSIGERQYQANKPMIQLRLSSIKIGWTDTLAKTNPHSCSIKTALNY